MKEPNCPDSLKKLQQNYSKSITAPFQFLEEGAVCDQTSYDTQLLSLIENKGGLTSADRLQTYNEQYWYRLFTVMQEEYPLTCALMGFRDFNILVTKYLTKYSSRHYSLTHLSDSLLKFIKETEEFRLELIGQAAKLDRIYIELFDCVPEKSFQANDIMDQDVKEDDFSLRTDLCFFEEHWNLVSCRSKIKMKQIQDDEVPLSSEVNYWCIYRDGLAIKTEPLGGAQYLLLKALHFGNKLEEAFSQITEHFADEDLVGIEEAVPKWFKTWSSLGWFKWNKK